MFFDWRVWTSSSGSFVLLAPTTTTSLADRRPLRSRYSQVAPQEYLQSRLYDGGRSRYSANYCHRPTLAVDSAPVSPSLKNYAQLPSTRAGNLATAPVRFFSPASARPFLLS